MKALIRGFNQLDYKSVINDLVENNIINEAYFITWDNFSFGDSVTILSTEDIALGRLDVSMCKPLDSQIIQEYSDTEIVCMKMIERLGRNKNFDNDISFDVRKHYYYQQLRYWISFIDEKQIDLFLSTNYPHEVYEYIIYDICKKKGIDTLFMHQGMINGRYFICSSLENQLVKMKEHYAKMLIGNINYDSLDKDTKSTFDNIVKKNQPFYMNKLRGLKKVKNRIKEKFIKNEIESELGKYCKVPDLNRKFLYFALHFQPELTTSPNGLEFVDQYLIADMLSYYVDEDTYIYIKEHPKQGSIGRRKGYYKEIAKLRNTILVDQHIETFSLITNCVATVSCTGTIIVESLVFKKPSLSFGNYIYNNLPHVKTIRSNDDCMKALKGIKAMEISDAQIFAALKAMEMSMYKGYVDYNYKGVAGISESRNILSIFEVLKEKINLLK